MVPDTAHYALALVGVDRPGIVASITGALAAGGCNLEDVSTSLLRGVHEASSADRGSSGHSCHVWPQTGAKLCHKQVGIR